VAEAGLVKEITEVRMVSRVKKMIVTRILTSLERTARFKDLNLFTLA
jgi:hypothetical protein